MGTGANANVDDPLDLSDERVERMDRVATLYGEITAATRAFLAALVLCERHRDWAAAGFGSCAEWLAWRIGVTRNTANEKVRAALALEELPEISEAMARGEISYSKVRALTRVATPGNEAELLDFARAGSAANLERLVRSWRDLDRRGEAERERRRHRSRRFSVVPDGEGMYIVRGRLDPEVAAVVMRAIEAASDALYASEREGSADEKIEPRQRRADALGLIAERALSAGFAAAADAPDSGSRAERYQVVVHVDRATLAEEGVPGRSELDDGTRVSAETARRVACDARRVFVETDPVPGAGGAERVLAISSRRRIVPPRLRRALEIRDRGCRFPGCGLRFTDAHHIQHWGDGGRTELANLVLLCRRHHRLVHEGGYRICSDRDGRTVVFFTRSGRAIAGAPRPPALPTDPVAALVSDNRARGAVPSADGLAPSRRHDRDIPWTMEAAAREALDPPD